MSNHASDPLGVEARWYAVLTHPRHELRAKEHLERQGFEIFLPLRRRTVRRGRHFMTAPAAFFPRYLFVRLDEALVGMRRINSTYYVSRLVCLGERPARVPDALVESLRACADATGIIDLQGRLKPGDRVRILAGPLADRIAVLTRLEGTGAVRVLLELMGMSVSVKLPAKDVEPGDR